ncbi:MAG: ABC transporter ATP-binding protein [Silicimonas sp.]|nr:ABC transporter ATP-binding protein [Silicimonas sp.]
MLRFCNVSKSYALPGGTRHILRNMTLDLPGDRSVAIVGRNGAGKSTLLRMVSGILNPDRGVIERVGKVSWPLGFSGGFHPALTGRQNARFIARVYGADTDEMVEFVEDFSELGGFLDMPFQTYSTGMRARLAFGVSMAADFDWYLVDEITAVGDKIFKEKCRRAFEEKLSSAQLLMVSHSDATLRDYCEAGLMLNNGEAWYFEDLNDALAAYQAILENR